jgi:hypothetical protein
LARAEPDGSAQWLDWYKSILQVRREEIIPLIKLIGGHAGQYRVLGRNATYIAAPGICHRLFQALSFLNKALDAPAQQMTQSILIVRDPRSIRSSGNVKIH